MPSATSIILAMTATAVSAQYTTTSVSGSVSVTASSASQSVSISTYNQAMPSLSTSSSLQRSQPWNSWSPPSPVSTPVYSSWAPVISTSSVPYENPFTVYLSQTNSDGVITGMPDVVTSQPTQPAVVTNPAGVTPSTLATSARITTSLRALNQSTTTSGLIATKTSANAGAKDSVASAGLALVLAGMIFSLL